MVNIRICPKCKKPTLKNAFNLLHAWGSPPKYRCDECDYLGFFSLEIDPDDYKIDSDDKNFNTEEEKE